MATIAAPGSEDALKFSIFNPTITFEHREFYERIVGELNGIFPICNQGKCTALEVSEDATEQEQITDLMLRVESFSGELLDVTKKLFDQFYQAKEDFSRMIFSTTAYIKINLMDRNLLETTCDVRWWALETAFSESLQSAVSMVSSLEDLSVALNDVCVDDDGTVPPELRDFTEFHRDNVRWMVSDQGCQQLLSVAGRLAVALKQVNGKGRARRIEAVDQLQSLESPLMSLRQKLAFACDRLEDIINSYTLYRDLVITDKFGFIIANANKETRASVLGLRVDDEVWFSNALDTKDGTQYFAQDVTQSRVESTRSLVYSTAVREKSDNYGKVLGAMGVFFDFQDEATMILED